jgi:putative transposase
LWTNDASVLHYRARSDSNNQLCEHIVSLAGKRRRFGCGRIHVLLKPEGWQINVTQVYRLYCLAGLSVRIASALAS